LLWDYVEKGDVVVAAARYDGGLFEIAFADDEQRFALSSGPDEFTREELGEGAFAELTSHARTMPRTGSPASRLFTDAFTVRDDEELVGTFESQLAAMQRETQSALAQLKQQHAAEVRGLRQEVASMRREAQQFSQRAQVPTQGTRVSQVNAPSRHSPHTDPTPHAIETEFVVQTPTSPRSRGDLRSLWSQRLREATSELPSTLPNRVSVVAKEVLEAMARIVERGSIASDVRGDQRTLLRTLQDAPDGLTFKPNRRSFGAAIQWIAQHELLMKMISRQEWLIQFGQVEVVTP
jgi:hypothetical protein